MHVTFFDNLLRTLSWTFIHSLWQGLILTILAGVVMLATKKMGSAVRYVLLSSLFFLFLGSAAITFLIEWNAGTAETSGLKLIADQPRINALFHDSVFRQLFETIALFLNANAQWIVFSWLVILLIKAAKMMLDLVYVHRLRNHQLRAPGEEWTLRIQSLCGEIGISKKVALIESALVRVPLVVGHLKPVILVPAGILANLPAGEVEAVLLHELAHIRRHDYLVNFIQRIAELLFFFNPALLWVSSLLRIERENCCDDIAIDKTKNKLQFVEALIRFKEHSLKHQEYALGLFGKRNLLLQRMSRIVYNRNKALSRAEIAFFALSFILLLMLIPGFKRPVAKQKAIAEVNTVVDGESTFIVEQSLTTTQLPLKRVSQKQSDRSSSANAASSRRNSSPVIPETHGADADLNVPVEYVSNGRLKTAPDNEVNGKETLQKNEDLEHLVSVKNQPENDRQAADRYRELAEKERMRAKLDRERAGRDRAQAEKDRLQAEKDRLQAEKDRAQAELDRKQADKDRAQAELDRKEAQRVREAEKWKH